MSTTTTIQIKHSAGQTANGLWRHRIRNNSTKYMEKAYQRTHTHTAIIIELKLKFTLLRSSAAIEYAVVKHNEFGFS